MKRYKVIDTDCEADVWFDNVENKPLDYKDIEKILEKQCSQWQKLKEWLEEKKNWNERQLKEAPINTEFYIRVSVQGITINKVLDKMQELEGEDER